MDIRFWKTGRDTDGFFTANIIHMLIVIAIVLAVWVMDAFPASFDCKKAGTPTEKAICTDAELSGMDEEMSALYKESMDMLDNTGLKADQKAWIKEREKCGDNVQCLKYSYQLRYNSLRSEVDTVYGGIKADGYYDENVEETEDAPPEDQQVSGGAMSEADILSIVNGSYFTAYPNMTIGNAFNRFDNPQWIVKISPNGGYNVRFTGNISQTVHAAFYHFSSKGMYKAYPKELKKMNMPQFPNLCPVGEKVEMSLYIPKDISDITMTRLYNKTWHKQGFGQQDVLPAVFHEI